MSVLSGVKIGTDKSFVFANSALINAQATAVDVTFPPCPKSEYMVTVYNPSTVTDLTVKIFSKALDLASDVRYGLITTLNIPKAATITGTAINTYSFFVHGAFNASDVRIIVSNDTALGVADGFTATLRIREVE